MIDRPWIRDAFRDELARQTAESFDLSPKEAERLRQWCRHIPMPTAKTSNPSQPSHTPQTS